MIALRVKYTAIEYSKLLSFWKDKDTRHISALETGRAGVEGMVRRAAFEAGGGIFLEHCGFFEANLDT